MSTLTLIPRTTIVPEANNHLIKCNYRANSLNCSLSFQSCIFPHSASLRLFPRHRKWSDVKPVSKVHILGANETKIAVESVSAIAREDAEVPADVVVSETPPLPADSHIRPNVKSKRRRPLRKSERPPVENEDLVPGATFTGKIRSIQPFGVFVDIGAFTEGLIHISNLSDTFVADVKSIVSIGQEVKVRVLGASVENGRISLTMRENNDIHDLLGWKDSSSGSNSNGTEVAFEELNSSVGRGDAEVPADVVLSETPSSPSDSSIKPNVKSRRQRPLRKSKMPPLQNEDLVPGATFTGKVQSIQPFGAFVDIGAFTEGLIHISNLSDSFVTDVKGMLSIGQEVKVRVVEASVENRRISLTMRENNDATDLQQRKDTSSGNNSNNGTKVTIEESSSAVAREDAEVSAGVVISETPLLPADSHIIPNVKSKRQKPLRNSEMPQVKSEDLVPGATFTGKVRSIQSFGAFVDIGAFTEGLIHISNLSDSFLTDVKSIVSIGQEVKVRVVEASVENRRISLTMREKLQQQKDLSSANNSNKPTPARKNTTMTSQKSSKFVKGQELEGTVKNIIRAGSFISLPEGEEGFLPTSEESVEGFGNIMGDSSLQVGQEVRVRVLYVKKGRVTLTMKKEDDIDKLEPEVIHVGVVHEGTKPFVFAFRKNKDIAKFLDEREMMQRLAES